MTPRDDGFFAQVTPTSVPTSSGPCPLPIVYRDGAMLGLVYRLDPARVAPLLEGTDLEVWPILGRAVALVCAWEYRDSSVGPYGELGIGVYAKKKGSRPSLFTHLRTLRGPDDVGIWVINLPVTTQAAYAAGVEIWGYPKYVTPIDTRFEAERAEVTLGDELTVQLDRGSGPRTPGFPIITFTRQEGRLVRTVIDVDHRVRWGGRGKVVVRGDGPCARTARALGLDVTQPMTSFRTEGFRAILPAGVR